VSNAIADSLAELDDDVLAARRTDMLDVGERIARAIAGVSGAVTLDHPGIVVADDLTPSATAMLPWDSILGIILGGASPNAHAAILARAHGLPAIVGAAEAVAAIRATAQRTTLAMDGGSGEIVLNSGGRVRARFARLAAVDDADRERDRREAVQPAITLDGVAVMLQANISGSEDAARAADLGARGVGLFRTEFLFLERDTPPSEDEQVAAYRAAIEMFRGDPVTIDLLDVGGDKAVPYLSIPREDNPFLGVRGLRLAGKFRDVFATQLRACYRAAAAGPVKVMAPMITDRSDVEAFLGLAAEARDAVTAGTPPARWSSASCSRSRLPFSPWPRSSTESRS
jgi:phosphocarrier protein FPr